MAFWGMRNDLNNFSVPYFYIILLFSTEELFHLFLKTIVQEVLWENKNKIILCKLIPLEWLNLKGLSRD